MTTKEELEKELDKFREELKKRYIDNMMSGKYHTPPESKPAANFMWLEVAVVFDTIMNEMLNQRSK